MEKELTKVNEENNTEIDNNCVSERHSTSTPGGLSHASIAPVQVLTQYQNNKFWIEIIVFRVGLKCVSISVPADSG